MKEEITGSSSAPAWTQDDAVLVSRLIECDGPAWEYVIKKIIEPCVAANPRGIRDQLRRASLGTADVVSAVFQDMVEDDCRNLRAFRFECSFKTYMFSRVVAAAQGELRKAVVVKGGGGVFYPEGNVEEDGSRESDWVWQGSLMQQGDCPRPLEKVEDVAQTDKLLGRLWEENPAYALVVLLKDDLELSSKETGSILGKGFNNVDQTYKRAHQKLRDYSKALQE